MENSILLEPICKSIIVIVLCGLAVGVLWILLKWND